MAPGLIEGRSVLNGRNAIRTRANAIPAGVADGRPNAAGEDGSGQDDFECVTAHVTLNSRARSRRQEMTMADLTRAKYAELREHNGQFVIALLDAEKHEVGFGYKGPTLRRAEQDLKYWTREKGLELLPR